MNKSQLIEIIKKRNSFLCIGLDTDVNKLPKGLPANASGMFEFNKKIIDATRNYCVSYKPNTAFYEALGAEGWKCLEQTVAYIGKEHFIICDAKRGDIGNTAQLYAKAFFESMQADALTVAPYMGVDSVLPMLSYKDKVAIVLALTSNESAMDFQVIENSKQKKLYEQVIERMISIGNTDNLMFVVGATKATYLAEIRKIIPNHFLLVPGVGAQGGSLEDVYQYGKNNDVGLLVNVSRQILYASNEDNYAEKAAEIALEYQQKMKQLMTE